MTPFLSKRLLINLAVVVAAVGANAFVAYTQICGQRDAAERMLRSTSVRQHIDGYHLALDGAWPRSAVSRHRASRCRSDAAAAMATSLAGLERELRQELAGEPRMLDALATLSADSHALQRDIDDALLKSAATASAVSATAAGRVARLGRVDVHPPRARDSIAWKTRSPRCAVRKTRRCSGRSRSRRSDTQRAMFLLIVTMLAGSALLIFTFGARESRAREKLRTRPRAAAATTSAFAACSTTIRCRCISSIARRCAFSPSTRPRSSNTATRKTNSSA